LQRLAFSAAAAAIVLAGALHAQQPAIPGFDPANLDRSVSPCENFYRFSCGGWTDRNPVPADQSRWGRFDDLRERNLKAMRAILEEASAKANPDPIERKIGAYYGACMDEAGIQERGLDPLERQLEPVRALESKAEIPALAARLHGQGVSAFFYFGSMEDPADTSKMVADLDQSGLGLPDRDYYLKDDERFKTIREQYRQHVSNMFESAGYLAETAAENAATVLRLETLLAEASMDRVARRDPNNVVHPTERKALDELTPAFAWKSYFDGLSTPAFASLNVSTPDFFRGLDKALASEPFEDWKVYLEWHVIHAAAPLLPRSFVEENFAFYGKALTGAQELSPRWKRCVQYTDSDLGEALGQKYVEKHFPPAAKQRMEELVHAVEAALEQDIRQLDWMTEETKKKALRKLDSMRNKIGHPEKWRDYSALEIKPDDALGNSVRSNAFALSYDLEKIGKASDKNEWSMSAPTVNAYYHPLQNNINFPAGILQPPFFDNELDDAVNFGAIGAVIGHELTHGFDDSGRQFDYDGALRDWWTEADGKAFEERASCFDKQYAGYSPVEGVNLNGKLTLGENTADNGGLRIALMALEKSLESKRVREIDGFTPQQRLFLGWSQVWCQNITEEAARLRAQTDPHSPGEFRVNGVVSNMPEFRQAFSCKTGQPMAPENMCRVW
jgi:predicted metalloendopeptidase